MMTITSQAQNDNQNLPATSGSLPADFSDKRKATVSRSGDLQSSIPRREEDKKLLAISKASLQKFPAGLMRNHTKTPALNEAIWSNPNNDTESTTSSSSDSSEKFSSHQGEKWKKGRGITKDRSHYSRFHFGNDDYKTRGKVSKRDGRLKISVNETKNMGYLAKALGASFLKHMGPAAEGEEENRAGQSTEEEGSPSDVPPPKMNIVVMVIGSRGDIQPFLKLGKDLKEYGHRVRIATHPAFKEFVEIDSDLEFFSVGGDPAELMAFMVKNPGMIPTIDTLKKGEVGRRRDQMAEMFEGFWRACINATDDEKDVANLKMMGLKAPFIADAIIANPPSFAHIHCAERLGIPFHLMFTFPYTPTQAFPHPLSNIKKSNVDPGYTNFMSYPLVEMMTWQGLGDLVNHFRVQTLGLESVSTLWAPGQLYRLKVPYTYLWSPALVPKPKDWGPEIDIAGFVYLDLASTFEPPQELVKFLNKGDPPVYIGFGSIVVDDPNGFTKMIFEAVEKSGVRALVSKGWGGLGEGDPPENVYMLENTPHDWLFPRVSAIVHHGGAGTTAIGLKAGKPTMIVPFFGDQQFWGKIVAEAGAGPEPVPYKRLTVDSLAKGITQCLTDEAQRTAKKFADSIEAEGDGAQNAVMSFHRRLVLSGQNSMCCSLLKDRIAVWSLKKTTLRLSALAAELLVGKRKIEWRQLRLLRHNEWNDFGGPGEPLTGGATAIVSTITQAVGGVGSVPFRIAKNAKKRSKHEEKRKRMEDNFDSDRVDVSRSRHDTEVDRQNPSEDDGSHNTGINDHTIKKKPAVRKKKSTDSKSESKLHQQSSCADKKGKHKTSGEPFHPDESESDLSDDPEGNMAGEVAQDIGSGFGRTAEAIARAPMDLSLAIAQGFHNAPRLYGDRTVRRPTRITGIKSGLKAAKEEFVYGIYDGVTGLVRQPYKGARENGTMGFVKGVGMGLTGFVLKDLAALFGPLGYAFKGMHKEFSRQKQPTKLIRSTRILEGQRDHQDLDEDGVKQAVDTVSHGWAVVEEMWAMVEKERSRGLRGQVGVRRRKTWRADVDFENIEMAENVIEAMKKGHSSDAVFK